MPLRRALLMILTPFLLLRAADPAEDAIRGILDRQQAAWNLGDMPKFVADYHDAPDTTFVGSEVTRGGRQLILERYQRRYSSRAAMGRLVFSAIEVRMLSPEFAIATGQYHLDRRETAFTSSTGPVRKCHDCGSAFQVDAYFVSTAGW